MLETRPRRATRRAAALVPDERARDLERVCQTLESRLVGVSELYNDVASRYGMWDVCLATLKVCGHDDEPLAVKLWTSLIKRLVPNNARDPELRRELTSAPFWVVPGCTDAQEPFWEDDYDDDQGQCFEDGAWRRPLRDAVSALGRELGADELGAPGVSRGDDAPGRGRPFPEGRGGAFTALASTRGGRRTSQQPYDARQRGAEMARRRRSGLLDAGAPRVCADMRARSSGMLRTPTPCGPRRRDRGGRHGWDAWALKARDDGRALPRRSRRTSAPRRRADVVGDALQGGLRRGRAEPASRPLSDAFATAADLTSRRADCGAPPPYPKPTVHGISPCAMRTSLKITCPPAV